MSAARRHAGSLLAVLALAYLCVMLVTGARPRQGQFVPFAAAGVLRVVPAEVTGVELAAAGRRWQLARSAEGWRSGEAILSGAAASELELGLKALHATRPVRELRGAGIDTDAAEYGLDVPRLELRLQAGGEAVLALAFGGPSADGALCYVRREGEPGVDLVSPFVAEQWLQILRLIQE